MDVVENLFSAFDNPFSIWQIIGWVSVACFVFSYQILEPRKTLLMVGISALVLLPHLYGINAPLTTLVVILFGALRNFVAAFSKNEKWVKIVVVFNLFLVWMISFYIAQDVIDYLPPIASSFMSIASLFRDRFYTYRFFSIACQVTWVAVYLVIGSYAGLTLTLMSGTSNVIGVGRYILKNGRGT